MFINFVNDIFEIVLNPGLCDTLVGFLMSAGHMQNKREGRRKYFLPPSRFSKLTYKFRISHRLNKKLFYGIITVPVYKVVRRKHSQSLDHCRNG